MFGIAPKSYELMINAIPEMKEIEKADIYGLRAIGDFKPGSDIDIVR